VASLCFTDQPAQVLCEMGRVSRRAQRHLFSPSNRLCTLERTMVTGQAAMGWFCRHGTEKVIGAFSLVIPMWMRTEYYVNRG
jgi:hypothetical protein